MWTVDDWVTSSIRSSASEHPWQNLLLVTGNDTTFAQLSFDILKRTERNLPVLWFWEGWLECAAQDQQCRITSFQKFLARYTALRFQFPHLPTQPWGVYMGDEPHMLNTSRQAMLKAGLAMVRSHLPTAVTYLNMLFASLACPDALYCCCGDVNGSAPLPAGMSNATMLAKALGGMELDWISTDEYYDVSIDHYKRIYEQNLYPYLKPTQRVLLVPFAAFCELDCKANATINVSQADAHCLKKAQAHWQWAMEDDRVAALSVYRLKNLWQRSGDEYHPQADPCHNPWCTRAFTNAQNGEQRTCVDATDSEFVVANEWGNWAGESKPGVAQQMQAMALVGGAMSTLNEMMQSTGTANPVHEPASAAPTPPPMALAV